MKPGTFIILLMMCLSIVSEVMAQKKTPVYLAILPDNGGAVITYKSGDSHLLSLPDLAVVKKLPAPIPEDRAYQASLSPDGKRMAVFHDKSKKIVLWNIETGTILCEVAVDVSMNFYGSIYTFDPIRNQFICKVSAKGNKSHEFRIYDLADGKLIGPMLKMNSRFPIRNISLSPDGSRLLGYSGSALDNGELEVFDYKSGEQICEKWMGDDSEIVFASFSSNDSVEVRFRAHMATTSQIGKFGVVEKEKEIKASTDIKETNLFFDFHTNRFVIRDDIQLSGSYYAPEAKAFSADKGWLLVVARKSDLLALYDTRNTTDKELNGRNWKEPAQTRSVTLP